MTTRSLPARALLLAPLLLVVVGIDARFGVTRLSGDDIAYLDVANMIQAGNWKAALNPVWSIGYPLLLAGVRPLFGSSAQSEVYAILCLNLIICLAAWLAFAWLLEVAAGELSGLEKPHTRHPWFLVTAAAVLFLSAELALGRVANAGPDQLVACLFFAASAQLLRFVRQPDLGRSLVLGAILGIGIWVKAVLLPLGLVLFATAFLAARLRLRRTPQEPLAWLAGPLLLALIAAPYWTGLSWALGRPTLGESGSLNYAYHVNGLPHWMGWQGDPASSLPAHRTGLHPAPPQQGLGVPFHPLRLAMNHPPVFVFAEPYPVTYPPHFNLVFWYDGYRHFFSMRNTWTAVVANLRELKNTLFFVLPMLLAVMLAGCLMLFKRTGRAAAWHAFRVAWPLYLPSLFGLLLYLTVHVEDRYIEPFLAVLMALPILLAASTPAVSSRLRTFILTVLLLTLPAELLRIWLVREPVLAALRSGDDGFQDAQWTLGRALTVTGIRSGERVATIADGNDIRCGWAYVARVHIVAHLGNDAYDPGSASQLRDLHLFADDPATQAQVLDVFRREGAVAAIAPRMPFAPSGPGWQHVPGTEAWILKLR